MHLLPIIFCAIFATKQTAFPDIDISKLYNITATLGDPNGQDQNQPTTRPVTDSTQIEGLIVDFDNDEESIVVRYNTQGNSLKQNVTLTITPQADTRPNLLTVKTYEDLLDQVNIGANNNTVVINIPSNLPEGKFVLTYNGEVDVRLTSGEENIGQAQTYNFSSPLFLDQLENPVNVNNNTANFRLNNFNATSKLLAEFAHTLRILKRMFTGDDIPEDALNLLVKLHKAESNRELLAKKFSKTEKPSVSLNVVGCNEKIKFDNKVDIADLCRPSAEFKEDEYALSVCNALAVKTLFEAVSLDCDSTSDALQKFAQIIVNIETSITIKEAAVILYHAVINLTGPNSRQRDAYKSYISALNIDVQNLSEYRSPNQNINSAISSIFPSDCTEIEITATVEEDEEEEDEESNSASKSEKTKKSTGMSGKKKVLIASSVVVVVVAVTVSAVVFLT